MSRSLLTAIIASLLLGSSCSKRSSNDNPCKPESLECFYQKNRSVNANAASNEAGMIPQPYQYDLKSGNNLVFTYKQRFADCPDIMDDEGGRTIIIEVPEGTEAFYVVDNQAQCKVIMDNDCFCYNGYPHMISKGTVKGVKVGWNKWQIEARLYSDPNQTDPYYFKQVFTLKP